MKDYMKEKYLKFRDILNEAARDYFDKARDMTCDDSVSEMEMNLALEKAFQLVCAAGEFGVLSEEGGPFEHFLRRRKLNKFLNDYLG